jgi:hypothetical protein
LMAQWGATPSIKITRPMARLFKLSADPRDESNGMQGFVT